MYTANARAGKCAGCPAASARKFPEVHFCGEARRYCHSDTRRHGSVVCGCRKSPCQHHRAKKKDEMPLSCAQRVSRGSEGFPRTLTPQGKNPSLVQDIPYQRQQDLTWPPLSHKLTKKLSRARKEGPLCRSGSLTPAEDLVDILCVPPRKFSTETAESRKNY